MANRDATMKATPVGVEFAAREGVVELTLANPPGNRLTLESLERLAMLINGLATTADARVVWLHARGDDFCHGVDLRDAALIQKMSSGEESVVELATLGQQVVDGWANLPIPTIASARGHILGAGACLFLASDFRVAPASATICFPEVDRGMYLSWGIIPRLVAELGLPVARALALAGEEWTAGELPGGTVRIADAGEEDATGQKLARAFADKPPLAVRAIKATLIAAAASDAAAADPASFAATVQSKDFLEAMAAWMAKRPGKYTGK